MKFDWTDNDDWYSLSVGDQAAMLKTAVTMTDVVELCGHDVNKDKVRPPWNPTERTPSTHLYEDHFYDYASGKHGDIFDWIAEEDRATGEEPRSLAQAIKYIRRLALKGGKEPGDVDTVPVRQLENLDIHLLVEGNLPYDALGFPTASYGVMMTPKMDLLVPHWEYSDQYPNGYLIYGIKIRFDGGGKGAIPGSQFTHRLYDPLGWVPEPSPYSACVITEGESDCWAMLSKVQGQADVFALPSGASAWKDAWLEDLAPYDTVHVCFDNDRAGKAATEKVMRKIGYDRAKELRVPQLYNDVREAVANGWEPKL